MKEKYELAVQYYCAYNDKEALKILKVLANKGHISASCYAGIILLESNDSGIRRNYKKAFEYLKFAADNGDATAQVNIASKCFAQGLGCKKDIGKAIEYLKKAVAQKEVSAYNYLGKVYKDIGDIDSAIYWLNKGVKKDDVNCCISLAKIYFPENKITRLIYFKRHILEEEYKKKPYYNPKKAFLLYEKAFELANKVIAEIESVEPNLRALMIEKAKINIEEAGDTLGLMYCGGWGTKANRQKGLQLLYDLAKEGSKNSQLSLVLIYIDENEFSIASDNNKYFYWANKLSNGKGYLIADDYLNGRGTEKNYKKAFELYMKAAETEDSIYDKIYSKSQLAYMYEEGLNVKPNKKKAFAIYDKLVKNYEKEIERFSLGKIFYNYAKLWLSGHCDFNKPNKYKAKEYLEKAIKTGYEECKFALDGVNLELGIQEQDNKVKDFADKLINENLSNPQIATAVDKKLREILGEYNKFLPVDIKTNIAGAIRDYVFNIICGEKKYKKFDFTNVIVSLSKGLETILYKLFFEGYINYLKKKNVSPQEFVNTKSKIVQCLKNVNGEEYYEYTDAKEEKKNFTLGSLYYTLDERQSTNPISKETIKLINPHMIAYLDSIFVETKDESKPRDRWITDTMLSLSQKVATIALQVRNPSAHRSVMPFWMAETLANYTLFGDNLIVEILSLLKPSAYSIIKK